jgi:hypothetical protein
MIRTMAGSRSRAGGLTGSFLTALATLGFTFQFIARTPESDAEIYPP